MEPKVVGELRMEGCDRDRALAAEDRVTVDAGEHLDVGPDPLHEWSADEDGAERVSIEIGNREISLEGVDLATECVAAYRDVDDAEAALIGATIKDLGAKEDHSGASTEGGHPSCQSLGQGLEQVRRLEQHRQLAPAGRVVGEQRPAERRWSPPGPR